jgi:hypothetical protein
MRILIVFLAACASGFAQPASVEAACTFANNIVVSEGTYFASCSGLGASASAEIDPSGSVEAKAGAGGTPGVFFWAPMHGRISPRTTY